jgi:hypothetical protein
MTTAVQFEEWTIHNNQDDLTDDNAEGSVTISFLRPSYDEEGKPLERLGAGQKWTKVITKEELESLATAARAFVKLEEKAF